MENQDNEKTTLDNVEQYEAWKEELENLQNVDPGANADWEYIGERINALQADIASYEQIHAIIAAHAGMNDAEYWNTIAVEYDRQNGDM